MITGHPPSTSSALRRASSTGSQAASRGGHARPSAVPFGRPGALHSRLVYLFGRLVYLLSRLSEPFCRISALPGHAGTYHSLVAVLVATLAILLFSAGCDSALPADPEPTLVVEGFIDAGQPAPPLRLARTLPLQSPYDPASAAIRDAAVALTIGSNVIPYVAVADDPGLFRPAENGDVIANSGTHFVLNVTWNGGQASAEGTVPPPIRLLSADVVVPDQPVSAVLLDSLLLADSLAVGAYEGFIYPVEVTLRWDAADDPQERYWVRAQLRPYSDFPSTVVDLFLQSEAVFPEADAPTEQADVRSWTGVYAVGVEAEDDPVPDHSLRIAIIRSDRDYARFASSRDTPDRREPISNLTGAIGIFTAISVDSTRVQVGAHPIPAARRGLDGTAARPAQAGGERAKVGGT